MCHYGEVVGPAAFLPDGRGAIGLPSGRSSASRGFTGNEHRDRTIFGHARAAASRRGHPVTLPEGLMYVPGFLTEAEEGDVPAVLTTFELHPYVLHGIPGDSADRTGRRPVSQ
jgi:hypothetical protein